MLSTQKQKYSRKCIELGMESKIVQKLIEPVKTTLLLLAITTCAMMTFYGFVHTATVTILGEWIFSIGCTIGYFCLWIFFVWIGVWRYDNRNYG